MAFKTVLVNLNDVHHIQNMLKTLDFLIEKHNCFINGLYVIPAVQIYPSPSMHVLPEIYDVHQAFFKEHEPKVREACTDFLKSRGGNFSFETVQSKEGGVADEVIARGYQADLIIVPHRSTAEPFWGAEELTERVIFETGRPILALAPNKIGQSLGERVLVAWNNTRESTRALFDALFWMQKAQKVEIVCVSSAEEEHEKQQAWQRMHACLERHGIKATFQFISAENSGEGQAILEYAVRFDADLLVMGGYGHSRMREYIFGGVTHFALEHMEISTLFSH